MGRQTDCVVRESVEQGGPRRHNDELSQASAFKLLFPWPRRQKGANKTLLALRERTPFINLTGEREREVDKKGFQGEESGGCKTSLLSLVVFLKYGGGSGRANNSFIVTESN